jgi:hypothetical protein
MTPNTTGSIASIPNVALSIFRSLPRVLTSAASGLASAVVRVRTQLVDDYYDRRAGVGDIIGQRPIFKAKVA